MAKEASLANPSLPLHEVLESEFIALHGELPADYPISAEPAIRLKTICSAIHGLKDKRAALCLSGGGIRSATFGLGVLQGLARCGVLDKFHYLSTVAGGGFIGCWLLAWIHRAENGLTSVAEQLALRPGVARFGPEPAEIRRLRANANYLNPEIGLLSNDTWRLVATYFRNITAMSLILLPLLAAALTIPWLLTAASPWALLTWELICRPVETSVGASAVF
jgi:hypothetical protein